jgi:hypothetical protein
MRKYKEGGIMNTLSFAGDMARLQRAIAESHDLLNGATQCDGSLAPTSPSSALRCAMPSRKAYGKAARSAALRFSAVNP